jgi:hypothetical protein
VSTWIGRSGYCAKHGTEKAALSKTITAAAGANRRSRSLLHIERSLPLLRSTQLRMNTPRLPWCCRLLAKLALARYEGCPFPTGTFKRRIVATGSF